MIFAENTQVIYKGTCGVIDFICDEYIVVKLPAAAPDRNPPRLLVFRDNYKDIEIAKASTK